MSHADLVEVNAQPSPEAPPTPELTPEVLELPAEQILEAIPQASPAPLAPPAAEPGLPLQFLNQLLQKLGAARLQSLSDLLPAARLLLLAGLAGMALRLTGATLGAINEIPLLGGLLELVGLVAVLNFLARNAFKQQKRAELLERGGPAAIIGATSVEQLNESLAARDLILDQETLTRINAIDDQIPNPLKEDGLRRL